MSKLSHKADENQPQPTLNEIRPRARLPLRTISSNKLTRVPTGKKVVTTTESAPILHQNSYQPLEPFHHVEVKIGKPNDQLDVVEFENIIYRTLRAEENARKALKFEQREITMKDRNLMVDALCRFHYKLGVITNTFYRFLGIFDRYLSVAQVPARKLKLIACASFLIASKIEDVYPSQSTDLIQLSEKSFTQAEIFAAEVQIINAISFETTFATPLFYLTQFMRIENQTKETLLARYILEIMQSCEHFYGVTAALQASVAVMVTRILKGKKEKWTKDLAGYTQFTEEQLYPYALHVRSMLLEEDREETKFMRRKYGSDLFQGVAHVHIPSSFK
ncbi:hypothetical protein M9Y10_013244 [Tritrichomonas musculus]|uniref:Cyclin, N-terminal domain containing protein n=1 Tax=Tritrichomonas musculus TaxID=1915356 RepID=A0ABR2I6I1_9EUKA